MINTTPVTNKELSKEINDWYKEEETRMIDKPKIKMKSDGTPVFAVSNNVTRTTFNYIRDNNNLTPAQVTQALVAKGFPKGSVGSIVSQLIKAGLVARHATTKHLVTLVDEYDTLKTKQTKKKATKAKQAKKPRNTHQPSSGIAALNDVVRVIKPSVYNEWSAQDVLKNLNVLQAQALYAELQKLFGAKHER